MKITIKTIKGEHFQIDIETTDTILEVKGKVAAERPDFSVDRQKLIHSGKVLKDASTVAESGFKENDFLVCMVTKEVAKPAARPTATATASTAAPTATAAATDASAASSTTTSATDRETAPSTAQPTSAAPPAPPIVEISEEAIAAITAMGFPDAEARYALTAARGDGNLAVEFLTNGPPEQFANIPAPAPTTAGAPTSAGSTVPAAPDGTNDGPLAQLRLHPQFTQLQRLVQSNPAALAQVLEAIGQQDANLLATIHANHDAFVAMMNEPIVEQPANQDAYVPPAMSGMPGAGGMSEVNPAQLVQMLMNLPEEQRNQAAASMGMTAEQLNQFTAALSSMPPEQLQEVQNMMAGATGAQRNAQVIRLTPEELAAVRRLQELGFSEQQAVQAFIACDRNETLAANMLFDGGFGFDDDDGGDDMYN